MIMMIRTTITTIKTVPIIRIPTMTIRIPITIAIAIAIIIVVTAIVAAPTIIEDYPYDPRN